MGLNLNSMNLLLVLRALLDPPAEHRHFGKSLIDSSGVKAGRLYPILAELEQAGVVEAEWEDIDEAVEGRRRRRFYRLTDTGATVARARLNEVSLALAPPERKGPPFTAPQPGWASA